MKTYKLIFWSHPVDKQGKKLPAKALGEAIARDVEDSVKITDLCSHWEGFAKIFMRDMGIADYVTAEELP